MTKPVFLIRHIALLPAGTLTHTPRPHQLAVDRALHQLYPQFKKLRLVSTDTLGCPLPEWQGVLAVIMVPQLVYPYARAAVIQNAGGLPLAAAITRESINEHKLCLFAPGMKFHYEEHCYAGSWQAKACNHNREGQWHNIEVGGKAA